jgi:hypothetical protein
MADFFGLGKQRLVVDNERHCAGLFKPKPWIIVRF